MKKTPREYLDAAARTHVSDNLNLYPRIAAQLERVTFTGTLRARPVLMAFSILCALTLLTGVAYAVGRSIGYFPGVGIVEQGDGIYILAEPVSVNQAGIMVTVNRLVADSMRTYVAYRVDGIPPVDSGFPICTDAPGLALPDGSLLNFTGGGGGGMESYRGAPMRFESSLTFAPLPAQTRKVIFISPCQMPVIELLLVPAPINMVTPATEIEVTYESVSPNYIGSITPTDDLQTEISTPEPHLSSLPIRPTNVPKGSGLYLDKIIEMENSYVLMGNFTDASDLPGPVVMYEGSDSIYKPKIENALGETVSFIVRQDISPVTVWTGFYSWAYEIPKPVTGPLKITLDQVNIHQSDTFQFQFDTGPDPGSGEQWELNLPFKLGGYDYVIDQVQMLEKGYLLKWHSGIDIPEGTSFSLTIHDLSPSMTEASWGMEDRRQDNRINYARNFLTDEPVPTGILTFELTLYQTVPLPGPWTITWTPPTP